MDEALWAAVRALEEKADLVERLASDAHQHGDVRTADVFAQRAAHPRRQAQQVRDLVEDGWTDPEHGGAATGP